MLTFIIPALNEESNIVSTLQPLQRYRHSGSEVILVDAGSSDNTIVLAEKLVDKIIKSPQGRAVQQNCGAQQADGDYLLFLHADTRISDDFSDEIKLVTVQKPVWGRFRVKLSGQHFSFRVIERMMNWRSCLSGIATGDQMIFVRKDVFQKIGGFPEIALMEDIALSKILKRESPIYCAKSTIITSSRKWEENGILKTIFLMWRLRLLYFFGVSPQKLQQLYYKN